MTRRRRLTAGALAVGGLLLPAATGAAAASTTSPSPTPPTTATATARPTGSTSASPTGTGSSSSPTLGVTPTPGSGGGLPGPAAPLPTAVTPTPRQTPVRSAVEVTLRRLTPVAPQPQDTLSVSGVVRNVSHAPVSDLTLELRLGPALLTRSEFDLYAASPAAPLPATMAAVSAPAAARHPRLQPGHAERFRLRLPVARLGLPLAWQVHELGIAVQGTTSAGDSVLGQLRTFLPWAPRTAVGVGLPTRVAWVWPLVDRPHRGWSPVWLDDRLAATLAPAGRLGRLLAAGAAAQDQARPRRRHRPAVAAVPVTWALDPMLVEDATLMTAGYRVRAGSGSVAGAGSATATAWLATLRQSLSRAPVIGLPYADPDVDAATRGGLATTVGVADATGRALLSRALPGASLTHVGWPVGGTTDARGVDTLFAAGVTSLVLADTALPLTQSQPSETPSAPAVLHTDTGDLEALLFDSTLTDDVAAGATAPTSSPLTLQRYLAETLMIQAEAPYDQRSVVVAPPRRWSPSSTYATRLLADTGRVPWIRPTSLTTVLAEPVSAKVTRSGLSYPAAARHAELGASYVAGVAALLRSVADFGTVVPAGTASVRTFGSAAMRLLSSAYRGDRQGLDTLHADSAALGGAMSGVHIASQAGSFVTLTSHSGKVPVTIANDLDTDVRVELQVEANQRLTLHGDGRVVESIPAHQQKAVDVRAQAKTSGVFPLQVRLLTTTGHPYGRAVQLNVRSTVYGTVALVITGAATAALLLAVAVRLTRRALAARRRAVAPA